MTDSNTPTSMRYRREVNVANNTLASILERYNRVLEQVLQRIDILEKGQKLDRTQHRGDVDDFMKLSMKVDNMDQKLTARVNDLDERMKVLRCGDIGAQVLEVIQDHGSVNDAIQEMGRESARDVIDSFDFEHHHVERAVFDCIENMDLSEHFDEENIDVRRMDLDTLADYLVDERPLRNPIRQVDEHEERLDKIGDQMCMVIGMLERIGIATEPSSHTELFGDKRSAEQHFGDLVAKLAEEMSPDDRATHLNLMRDTVAKNVAEGASNEES